MASAIYSTSKACLGRGGRAMGSIGRVALVLSVALGGVGLAVAGPVSFATSMLGLKSAPAIFDVSSVDDTTAKPLVISGPNALAIGYTRCADIFEDGALAQSTNWHPAAWTPCTAISAAMRGELVPTRTAKPVDMQQQGVASVAPMAASTWRVAVRVAPTVGRAVAQAPTRRKVLRVQRADLPVKRVVAARPSLERVTPYRPIRRSIAQLAGFSITPPPSGNPRRIALAATDVTEQMLGELRPTGGLAGADAVDELAAAEVDDRSLSRQVRTPAPATRSGLTKPAARATRTTRSRKQRSTNRRSGSAASSTPRVKARRPKPAAAASGTSRPAWSRAALGNNR